MTNILDTVHLHKFFQAQTFRNCVSVISCYKGVVPALGPSNMLSGAGTCIHLYI